MSGEGFEVVSLYVCPGCGKVDKGHNFCCVKERRGEIIERNDPLPVQFVRVDQVVAALEGLATTFQEQGDAFMRIHERSKSNTAKAHTWGCAGAHLNAADDVRKLAANLTPTNKQED